MNVPPLNDENVFPSDDVIAGVLKESYDAYAELIGILDERFPGIDREWRFYKDGGWLCKCTMKKKTVFWFSVWDSYFKCSFFFSERNIGDIAEQVKEDAEIPPQVGKLIPVVFEMDSERKFGSLMKTIGYKTSVL